MGKGGHGRKHIIKSKSDTAEYEHITLPNGLQALLISDKDADKAAAAMDVRVFSWIVP